MEERLATVEYFSKTITDSKKPLRADYINFRKRRMKRCLKKYNCIINICFLQWLKDHKPDDKKPNLHSDVQEYRMERKRNHWKFVIKQVLILISNWKIVCGICSFKWNLWTVFNNRFSICFYRLQRIALLLILLNLMTLKYLIELYKLTILNTLINLVREIQYFVSFKYQILPTIHLIGVDFIKAHQNII